MSETKDNITNKQQVTLATLYYLKVSNDGY